MPDRRANFKQLCLIVGPWILFLFSVTLLLRSPALRAHQDFLEFVQTSWRTNIAGAEHQEQSASRPFPSSKLDSTPFIDVDSELYPPFESYPPPGSPPHQKPSPKITLIAIWNPQEQPAEYMPHFFASVGANSAHLDLVLIKFDKWRKGQAICETPLAHGVSNVREVCLTEEEYWAMHADYLCEAWGCTGDERELVVETLHERASGDIVNSYFRPFRAAVFKRYIDPRTPMWGWCDMDIMLGDFARVFPWDVAHNFDVLLTAPSGDFPDAIMVYLTGHLAVFRHASHVTDAFLQVPQLQSLQAFREHPWFVRHDTEECEYSHWLLKGVPQLTFLRFPAMVHSQHYIATLGAGVYTIAEDKAWNETVAGPLLEPSRTDARAALSAAVHTRVGAGARARRVVRGRQGGGVRTTFTDAGHEYEVSLREGQWEDFLWCQREDAVDFVVDHAKAHIPADGAFRRYVLRRTPNGPVYDHIEPIPQHERVQIPTKAISGQDGDLQAFEMLYKHLQTEKYRDWWAMPEQPLRPGEVLYGHQDIGMWVWTKEGRMTFDTRTAPTHASERTGEQ